MIEVKRILCPIDYSEFSRHALNYAIAVAQWYKSSVTALYVLPQVASLIPAGDRCLYPPDAASPPACGSSPRVAHRTIHGYCTDWRAGASRVAGRACEGEGFFRAMGNTPRIQVGDGRRGDAKTADRGARPVRGVWLAPSVTQAL